MKNIFFAGISIFIGVIFLTSCEKEEINTIPFCIQAPVFIDSAEYRIYEINERFSAVKYAESSEPSFDVDCDGVTDFKFSSEIRMYSPSEGWLESTLTPLHKNAFIQGFTINDTLFEYKDTAVQNHGSIVEVFYSSGITCRNSQAITGISSIGKSSYFPVIPSIEEKPTGMWINEKAYLQKISPWRFEKIKEVADTTYYWTTGEIHSCYDLPDNRKNVIRWEVRSDDRKIVGFFSLYGTLRLKKLYVKIG